MPESKTHKVIRGLAILEFVGAGLEVLAGLIALQGFRLTGDRDLHLWYSLPFLVMAAALVASGYGLWQFRERGRQLTVLLLSVGIASVPLFLTIEEISPLVLSTMIAIHCPLVVTLLVLQHPLWSVPAFGIYAFGISYLRRKRVRCQFVYDQPPL